MESILYLNSYDKPRELPENPDDLLDEGYEETTRPGTPDHIRKFRNPKTGDRIDLYLNSYDKPRELPENPDDLLDEGYEETTRPGTPDHIRKFRNPKTGDRIDFNKGKPNAPGWKGEDHWHRYNPNKTGKRDAMLDKNGNPVPEHLKPSHIGFK